MNSQNEYLDVIIVGAGLSGIGAAHHLQTNCPNKKYAILEARERMGGTWDLFQYPGIRSDSDMYTLGYSFRPWTNPKAIADGPAILDYIKETAKDGNIDQHIRFSHKVKTASWSSETARWTVGIEKVGTGEMLNYECGFLFMCSGYYSYDEGYTPDFEGVADFKGRLVHPQKWTKDIEYANKKVVVIGSGATAVTLVPEMSKTASHVTMLQRSPTYIVTAPSEDKIANFLRKILPAKVAYWLTRWKNVLVGMLFYNLARSKPNFMANLMKKGVKKEIIADIDIDIHFTPKYKPWDQRVCMVPDSDMFVAINEGRAGIVTDHIDRFVKNGILLKSGETLEADLVVSATGLKMIPIANLQVEVDGKKMPFNERFLYRGTMFSGIPNFALSFGYTNASWTLKSDLSCEYVCRLLNYMDKNGKKIVTPKLQEAMEEEPIVNFNSGYVTRALDKMPKQGTKRPWKLFQNYALDIFNFRHSKLEDGVLDFE